MAENKPEFWEEFSKNFKHQITQHIECWYWLAYNCAKEEERKRVALLKEKIEDEISGWKKDNKTQLINGIIDGLELSLIFLDEFAVDNASDSPRSALVESESSGEVSPRRSNKPSVNTEKSLLKGEPMLPSGGGAVSAKTMRVGGRSKKLRNSRLKRKPIQTKERKR